MNDMIDTSSDLRDLITVDFQEQMEAESDERGYNDLTMSDILEG
jgi:hypothetical protein